APVGARLLGGLFGQDGATIVGVVGDVQQTDGLGGSTRPVRESPTLYLAAAQLPANLFQGVHVWFSPHWLVRGSTSDAELSAEVAQVFRQVAPDLAVARTVAMRDVMAQAFARQRLEAGFLIAVAAFALLLAGIGLYGIVAYEVMERRSEMGLRMALGATPGEAVWATGVSGMRLTALGLVVGSLAAAGASRMVQKMVWGVEPLDPLVLTAMVAALAVLGATASFIPAARIGRLDPATVLREG
ncbi:MAG TPA: FtsX-like permease family protein, partial [Longimicrobiales bacterium]|nr:FtsX-like permease family protein [Longimicrobiales bacterium]